MKIKEKLTDRDLAQITHNVVRTCSYDESCSITTEMLDYFLNLDIQDDLSVSVMSNPVELVPTKKSEFEAVCSESHRAGTGPDDKETFAKHFKGVVTSRYALGYKKLWIYCSMFSKSGQLWCRIGWSRK